jgi:hypothetical protein
VAQLPSILADALEPQSHRVTSDSGRAQRALEERLRRRIIAVLASIPGAIDGEHQGEASALARVDQTPGWISMPMWLDQAWAAERGEPIPTGALDELLWGQYALFLCIRLQDDLLDGARRDLHLILVADHFLLESLQAFQRFPELDDAFWALYRDWMRDTVNGDLEVERLEAAPGRFTTAHLDLHARVSAILKVGVAAVARLHGREQDIGWLSRFQDHLAVFHQIADDLDDLVPDLMGGRYTWVANTILALEPGESLTTDERARRLGEGFLRPERGATIAKELRRIAHAAAAEVPASAPQAIHDLVQGLRATADELERSMHETRVRWVFGEAVEQGAGGKRAQAR